MADIVANEPFTVSVPVDPALTDSVRFYLASETPGAPPVRIGEAQVKDSRADLGLPEGKPKGSYVFTARGVNAEGEGPAGEPAMLVLGGVLPPAPGTITFRFGVPT